MPSLNVYIRDADEPLFERLKTVLEKEGRSMAEFVAEAASKYVDYSNREPEQIELEGEGVKRRFKGHRLYWFQDIDNQQGVFLTAKRNIAYWNYVPRTNPAQRVEFEVYEDLDELFENQEWLAERHKGKTKQEIQKEYAAFTRETVVEELDI
jgi:hypothetical protein